MTKKNMSEREKKIERILSKIIQSNLAGLTVIVIELRSDLLPNITRGTTLLDKKHKIQTSFLADLALTEFRVIGWKTKISFANKTKTYLQLLLVWFFYANACRFYDSFSFCNLFFCFGLGQQLTEEWSHLTDWPTSSDAKQGVPASIVVCLHVYVFFFTWTDHSEGISFAWQISALCLVCITPVPWWSVT